MPRREIDLSPLISQLTAVGDGAPPVGQKLELVQAIRGQSREAANELDKFFVEELVRLRSGLSEARADQRKLSGILDKLAAKPWYPAVFLGVAETENGRSALVIHGMIRRVVSIADEVDADSLQVGDEVLLGHELNVIVCKSPYATSRCGETACFERFTEDGRMVLKVRDEELVVSAASALACEPLKAGDSVRWDRNLWIAYEKMGRPTGTSLFLEETPAERFEDIGGLDLQIEELQRSIRLHLHHADLVRKYRLKRKGSALFVGPPGTGKTMMARALANWLARISRSGRARFMNVKPGGLHSIWYSQSEANYREVFRVAREAGEREPEVPVVMFFDELDAIGSSRSDYAMRVDNRVLEAFMTELDGLESRGNILVVGATNRRDLLDEGLLRPGRFGDQLLEIGRPGRKAALQIFARHLPGDIPYTGDPDPAVARQDIIDSAVSRIYSPNAGNELLLLTMRDGKERGVKASDLVSGARIANIALAAKERAVCRELESGHGGIELGSVLSVIDDEFESAARVLTPANCHRHIDDLPHDVDVVRVQKVQRKVSRPHLYVSAA